MAIIWATFDASPRFTPNFDPNEFSENNRVNNWAKENISNKFSLDMPFVQKSRLSPQRLKAYLEEYANKNHKRHELKKCELGPFNDWRDRVINWWNLWIEEGWYHKRPQLLLVSPPNCGKTVFIREALFRQGQNDEIPNEAIMIPERAGCSKHITNFAWQKANPAYHSVVFCDEFDVNHYNIELLKIILQGDAFTPIKKYQVTGDDICLRIPMIFATNHMIKQCQETVGLNERFCIIEIPNFFIPFSRQNGMVRQGFYGKMFEKLQEAKNQTTASNVSIGRSLINFNEQKIEIGKSDAVNNIVGEDTLGVQKAIMLNKSMKKLSIELSSTTNLL